LEHSSAKAAAAVPDLLAVGGTYSASTILLPSLLSRFQKTHPGVRIDFRTNNRLEIERLLLRAKIDIAVTTSGPKSSRITAEPFRRERLAFVVSRRHPLARARSVSLHDIERTPLLVRTSGGRDGTTLRRLKSLIEEKGLKIIIGMSFESPSAMLEAIQRNAGIGIIHKDVARSNLQRGEFKEIKIRGLKLEGETYIIYLNDKPLSRAAHDFLKLLRQRSNVKTSTV
jgi:DNA-binding transcriptional LysR family regulator